MKLRLGSLLALLALNACHDDEQFEPEPTDSALRAPSLDAGRIDPSAITNGTIRIDRDARLDPPDVLELGENGACRTGQIVGTICAPSGRPIAAAEIVANTRTCRGDEQAVRAMTDYRGYFVLDGVHPGETTVTVTSGRFVGRFTATVRADQETALSPDGSPKVCLAADSGRLAVLNGDYDKIGAVIDSLGFDHDDFCGSWDFHRPALSLLLDFERLATYDILFINCASGINLRASNPEASQIRDNVKRFVQQGGSLYVSDLASDFISQLWPDTVRFRTVGGRQGTVDACCICVDCEADCLLETPDEPRGTCTELNDAPMACREPVGATGRGVAGDVDGTIISPFLLQFVDEPEMTVKFDTGGWVEIETISSEVEVLVAGPERPLMVLFEPFERGGRVVFTSFHNHVQATDAMLEILRALIFRL